MAGAEQVLGATPSQRNNRLMMVGGLALAFGGYWYFTRKNNIDNVGQAASHAGAAVGRTLEKAGAEDTGKGLQYKK